MAQHSLAPTQNPASTKFCAGAESSCAGLRWRWSALLRWVALANLRWGCAGAEVILRWAALCAGLSLRWLALGGGGGGFGGGRRGGVGQYQYCTAPPPIFHLGTPKNVGQNTLLRLGAQKPCLKPLLA